MAIVRNIQNNELYLYLGDNKFRNLNTGKEGVIDDEMAQKVFRINLDATAVWYANPLFEEMVKRLNLKFDNNKK